MDTVAFFKLQAKHFLKDWKTRYRDEEGLWQYRSRFIDVDRFFLEAGYGDLASILHTVFGLSFLRVSIL